MARKTSIAKLPFCTAFTGKVDGLDDGNDEIAVIIAIQHAAYHDVDVDELGCPRMTLLTLITIKMRLLTMMMILAMMIMKMVIMENERLDAESSGLFHFES